MLNQHLAPEWMFYAVCILSVSFGFFLRLALEMKDGNLSSRTISLQVAITACTSFLVALVKRDYTINMSIELLLFLTSFFAVFLVSTADKAFKHGFKAYLRMFLKRFLNEEQEEKS